MYGTRVKYNSTIYITIKGVNSPKDLPSTTRSTFPTQAVRREISKATSVIPI